MIFYLVEVFLTIWSWLVYVMLSLLCFYSWYPLALLI